MRFRVSGLRESGAYVKELAGCEGHSSVFLMSLW